jgi:hypothetical protein
MLSEYIVFPFSFYLFKSSRPLFFSWSTSNRLNLAAMAYMSLNAAKLYVHCA